jgi:pyruvate kinase
MPRQTKIVATLGPATDAPNILTELVAAGLDVGRINFSHGGFEDWARSAHALREAARRGNRQVALLADLQGPKIRIERFRQGRVVLEPGQPFVLDADLEFNAGDESAVGLTYKDLPRDLKSGDILLLDDGRIELLVTEIRPSQVHCDVVLGGELSNNKGLNLRGGGLSAAALTAKDYEDVRHAAEIGVDYLAVSFPKGEDDINEARGLLLEAGLDAGVVAKIERTEAVDNIDEIMLASDAVMVARGDLGVEIGDAELAGVQKNILRRAAERDCVVITATQMMESMVANPVPTRAELLDVANAVLDGTDAVMLSAETAVGKYPVQVVEAMDRICLGAEKHRSRQKIVTSEQAFQRVDEAIAKAAMFTANHFRVKAIAALTESGSTAMWMSRIRTDLPIYALTPSEETARRVALYRNVHPILISGDVEHSESLALQALEEAGAVGPGDLFLFTRGEVVGREGGTNTMKVMRVGEVRPG